MSKRDWHEDEVSENFGICNPHQYKICCGNDNVTDFWRQMPYL